MYLTDRAKTFIAIPAGIVITVFALLITHRHWVGWLLGGFGVLAVLSIVLSIVLGGGQPYHCLDCDRIFSKGSRTCPNCGGTNVARLPSK